jgi:hypothetical protein
MENQNKHRTKMGNQNKQLQNNEKENSNKT